MVANLPAHTRVVVLGEGDIPAFSGTLLDPPTTYGDMYQIKPDESLFPDLMLAPIDLVHPEPPPDTGEPQSPTFTSQQAAKGDAREEFQVTIATLRRQGISIPSIRALFLSTLNQSANGDSGKT